jgi:16S rRNA (cytosine1402-N4)-methyltransferase
MDDRLSKMNLVGEIDGVLMDIGVSSPQLDEADRGFSFMRDGPLDMRMNQDAKLRAYEYLQAVTESELERVLSEYGEERYAKRIAKAIVQARSDYRLKDSTLSLVEIVMKSGIRYEKNKHPATRTFQAIRIAVNAEIDVLALGLEAAFRCLKVGGRLAVISFHGLEHRVVKQFIRKYKGKEGSLKFVEKIGVGYFERKENRRSRSAYLRVMEKLR